MFLRAAVLFAFIALLAGCVPDASSCGTFGLPCCVASPTQPACYSSLVCVPRMGTPGTCGDTPTDTPRVDAADGAPIGRDTGSDTAPPMDSGADAARDATVADVPGDTAAPDARTDVTPGDGSVDAPADARDAATPPDAAADVPSDVPARDVGIDAPADVASPDVATDAGADAAPDVASPDVATVDAALDTFVAPDVPAADVQPDSVDAGICNTCTLGDYRCNASTSNVERCWLNTGGCLVYATATTCSSPAGLREVCVANACSLCGVPAGGAPGCAVLCAGNADCHDRGYARCSTGGVCARRGYLRCTTSGDCAGFSTGTVTSNCTLDVVVDGVPARVCDGTNVARCSSDAMCTQSTRCNLATGFCQ